MTWKVINVVTQRVIETHPTEAQAQHAVEILNAHNARWGHATRYVAVEGHR